jgi:ligand-binding sensor domain-containing protein
MRVFLIFYSVIIMSFAQLSEYSFFNRQTGISNNTITDLYLDSDGFLWLATIDGLNRFDGNDFKKYKYYNNDSLSVPSNNITSVSEDSHGDLWVSTWGSGIARYSKRKQIFQRIKFKDQENVVKSLLNINDSILFICTWGEGFLIYNKFSGNYEKVKITEKKSLKNQVRKIISNTDNHYFILTTEGLFNFDLKDRELKPLEKKLEKMLVNKDIRDVIIKNDHLYIATYLSGFAIINLADFSVTAFTKSNSNIKSNNVNDLHFINETTFLIGTWSGLQVFDTKNLTILDKKEKFPTLSEKNIKEIIQITKNSFAVSTTNGFHIIKEKDKAVMNFSEVKYQNELYETGAVLQVYKDSEEKLWIATQKGVFRTRIPLQENEKYLEADFNLKSGVFHFAEDQFNNIWMASQDGLFSYKNKNLSHYERDGSDSTSLFTRHLSSLYSDGDILWIGSAKGLEKHVIGSKKFTHYKPMRKKKNCEVLQIIKSSDEKLILATEFGLQEFDIKAETFTIRKTKNKNLDMSIASVHYEKADKKLYLATNEGLAIYNLLTDSVKIVNELDGLPNSNIINITTDGANSLWLSTLDGLCHLNMKNQIITSYKEHIALKDKDLYEFSGAHISGQLLLGHKNGLLIINPDKFETNEKRSLYIDQLIINGKKIIINPDNDILYELESNENNLNFKYSAIDYLNNQGIKFYSKLNGVDTKWNFQEKSREINYVNLKPGDYQFELKATDEFGNELKSVVQLPFKIKTPFYQTLLFKVTVIFILFIIIFLLHRFRVRHILIEERTRHRIARNLHDDLGATISSIRFLTAIIGNEQSSKIKELGRKIEEQAKLAYQGIKDVIWTIEPENDSVDDLINHCIIYSENLLKLTNIDVQISRPKLIVSNKLSAEKRHHLWLMYKELIANLLKHSSCRKVKIRFILYKKQFRISVIDDGSGFEIENKKESNGLQNLKERSDLIGSHLEINSKHERGTKISISCLV